MSVEMTVDRESCLAAIARVKRAADRAEPVLVRMCGPLHGELGFGREAVQDAVRLRTEVLSDLPEVVCLQLAALRLGLAFGADVDFDVLDLPPFALAAVQLFLDEVKAGRVPTAGGGRVRARP